MVQTRNNIRRVFKGIVFVLCLIGFIYQTYAFLKIYLDYSTIQDVEIEYPTALEAPAFTICSTNRIKRQLFCTKYPDKCNFTLDTWEKLCEHHPLYCHLQDEIIYNYGIPFSREDISDNFTNEYLKAVGPQNQADFYGDDPAIKRNRKRFQYKDSVLIQMGDGEGKPYKCISSFSLIGKPKEEPETLSIYDKYDIWLTMHPEELMWFDDEFQVYLNVHDTRSLSNPFTEGIRLNAGYIYELYVTMQDRESLPFPYKSMCTDYRKLWKKNGGQRPVTEKQCMETCKIDATVERYGCVDRAITYPNSYEICPSDKEKNAKAIKDSIRNCTLKCREACKSILYLIKVDNRGPIGPHIGCLKHQMHCGKNYILTRINFNRMVIEKLKNAPKFQGIEFFSYVGGYVGMWLGISLIACFDLLEIMIALSTYPFFKKKKKNPKINPDKGV